MLKNSKEAAFQGPRVLGCIIYSILHKYLIEPVPICTDTECAQKYIAKNEVEVAENWLKNEKVASCCSN